MVACRPLTITVDLDDEVVILKRIEDGTWSGNRRSAYGEGSKLDHLDCRRILYFLYNVGIIEGLTDT